MWKSSVRCPNAGAKPTAAQPVTVTSWHDVPSGGPTNVSRASSASASSRPARERVAGGEHRVQRVGEQRAAVEARVVGGRRLPRRHRDRDVDVAAREREEAVRRLLLAGDEREARMAGAQRDDGGRDQLPERGGEAGEADGADGALGVRGDVGRRRLELREHEVGMADEHLGGAGQPHAAAVALDHRLPDLALERGELLRDGRRRQVQRVRRGGERALLGDLAQHAQAAGVDHAAELMG